MKGKVLLTGISGFLGSHTAIRLLENDYEVIGTLRNPDRIESIKLVLANHTTKITNLKFVKAELLDEQVWQSIIKEVDYVQHIASPFPRELPKDENEIIKPAKEGTLNILKAASANGVKRVVITSSIAAVVYGKDKEHRHGTFDESDWTDVTIRKDTSPYYRSKTIAEKAAWDFIKNNNSNMEIATVCPGAILGPILETDFGTSANMVIKLLDGSMPALPDIGFDIVDVRSVADLLILAMEKPEAANQRFIATEEYMKFKEVAKVLKEAYPDAKIPEKILPDFVVRLFANIDKTIKPVLIDLGTERKSSNAKAKQILNWKSLSNRKAILSCAESAIKLGLIDQAKVIR